MKLLSVDNVKTRKGESQGYLTAVLHLAPHTLSGSNMCSKASAGCSAACLNTAGKGVNPHIQLSRVRRTESYLNDRDVFLKKLRADLRMLARKAAREGLKPAARLNATSDQPKLALKMAAEFPGIQFYDYTKIKEVFTWPWPANYHATFSRSEINAEECMEVLELGFNVAAVFEDRPPYYKGYEVLNGDLSDLRFLDKRGCIVGLSAKGKGKRDQTGFVIRERGHVMAEETSEFCACGRRLNQKASEWAKAHGVDKPPRCVECLVIVFERKPQVLASLRAAVQGMAAPKPVDLDTRILAAVGNKDLHTYALIADELSDSANEVLARLHHLTANGKLVDVAGQPNRYYLPGTAPVDPMPTNRAQAEPTCEVCGGPRSIGSAKKCRKCYTAKKPANEPGTAKQRGGRKPAPCIDCGGERPAGPNKRCGDCTAGRVAAPSVQPATVAQAIEPVTRSADDLITEHAVADTVELPFLAGHEFDLPGAKVNIVVHADLFKAAPNARGLIEGLVQFVQKFEAQARSSDRPGSERVDPHLLEDKGVNEIAT